MPGVEAGRTAALPEQGDALRAAHRAAARGRGAGVVERLAEGVAGQELQPTREALVQLQLQSVVVRLVRGLEIQDGRHVRERLDEPARSLRSGPRLYLVDVGGP